MVYPSRFDSPKWIFHRQGAHHSGPTLGLGDVRFRRCAALRASRRNDGRGTRQPNNLTLDFSERLDAPNEFYSISRRQLSRSGSLPTSSLHWQASHRWLTHRGQSSALVFPLIVLAVVYFLLNSWLIAVAVALEQRAHAFGVWRRNFMWLSLNYFSGASVAALLLPYVQGPGYAFIRVIGVLLPLLLISYLTLKTALGRVEDANRHLAELNRLYLSTIETLAMAIDAKDQITHGHIRRVQIFAVGLANAMGVN